MKRLVIKEEEFVDTPFNSLLASGDGRRLWASITIKAHPFKIGDLPKTIFYHETVFKIEDMKKDSEIVFESESFPEAVKFFNEM